MRIVEVNANSVVFFWLIISSASRLFNDITRGGRYNIRRRKFSALLLGLPVDYRTVLTVMILNMLSSLVSTWNVTIFITLLTSLLDPSLLYCEVKCGLIIVSLSYKFYSWHVESYYYILCKRLSDPYLKDINRITLTYIYIPFVYQKPGISKLINRTNLILHYRKF